MNRFLALFCLFFSTSLFLGCGGERIVPVSGIVTIDGKPLDKGFVRFIPDNARAASAEISRDGRFVLSTNKENDGCVVGLHKVEVISNEFPSPTQIKWLIPRKYADLSTSGLEFTIQKAEPELKIELTWAGGKPEIENMDTSGDVRP